MVIQKIWQNICSWLIQVKNMLEGVGVQYSPNYNTKYIANIKKKSKSNKFLITGLVFFHYQTHIMSHKIYYTTVQKFWVMHDFFKFRYGEWLQQP